MPKQTDVPTLIRALRAQGFTVETRHSRTGSSRCKVTSPSGQVVIMPGPGKRTQARALLNARAALRRIGADV
ncbi:hypothetical protein ACIQCF_33330 [Streptomyces sp. NPDC088353]|uniref:hypothetical protein n=1 Tax=Streptomyces sp. NPDC088353 TaxID=3365855 RepID=UPI003827094B